MNLVNIKPVSGKIVRDPYDGFEIITTAGKLITWNSFWQRRLNDGDIIIIENANQETTTANSKKGAK